MSSNVSSLSVVQTSWSSFLILLWVLLSFRPFAAEGFSIPPFTVTIKNRQLGLNSFSLFASLLLCSIQNWTYGASANLLHCSSEYWPAGLGTLSLWFKRPVQKKNKKNQTHSGNLWCSERERSRLVWHSLREKARAEVRNVLNQLCMPGQDHITRDRRSSSRGASYATLTQVGIPEQRLYLQDKYTSSMELRPTLPTSSPHGLKYVPDVGSCVLTQCTVETIRWHSLSAALLPVTQRLSHLIADFDAGEPGPSPCRMTLQAPLRCAWSWTTMMAEEGVLVLFGSLGQSRPVTVWPLTQPSPYLLPLSEVHNTALGLLLNDFDPMKLFFCEVL